MSDTKSDTKIMVGPGRMSYPHILEPQDTDIGQRYSLSLLLPPEYDTKPIVAALKAAWLKQFGSDQSKWPRGDTVRTPNKVIKKAEDCFRAADGSRLYGPEFDGWHVVGAACNVDYPPGVVDGNVDDVSNKAEVYAGRWARMTVNAYGYVNKTRGVTLGLNNVQILKNDKSLGGKGPAKNDFDQVAEDMSVGETADESWD